MSKVLIEINNVSKRLKKKEIVKNVSLQINAGEIFGFLGPNGAGKTTMIRMIVGLISITKGDILIDGQSITSDREKALAKIGAVVENPDVYGYLTGYQNLRQYARMSQGVTKERIKEVVRLVDLEQAINRKVKTYSLGMRQRLGLAQALLHRPQVLILDEPSNGLDPAGIKEFREYLQKLAHEQGIAIFVSSHLLSEMELMCDRIGIIQNGELKAVQTVGELTNAKLDKQVYFQVAPVEQAVQCIQAAYPDQLVHAEAQGIALTIAHEEIPEVSRLLVQHQVKLYGITKSTQTLEDRFLELTKK